VIGFGTYLASLIGSWQALAVPHRDAQVIQSDGFVAARFPDVPIFDNALLFDRTKLTDVERIYQHVPRYAIWTSTSAAAATVASSGYVRDQVTVAMVCPLDDLASSPPSVDIGPVEVGTIAVLNELPESVLHGVSCSRAYATSDAISGVLLIEVGSDVNVSFVATRPTARRRGLATAVLRHALAAASADGFRTASLQATAMATEVYRRVGFRQVGVWQEWVPAPPETVWGR
jgi:ribosomal protein S18 acetylase RimI-like enzyme